MNLLRMYIRSRTVHLRTYFTFLGQNQAVRLAYLTCRCGGGFFGRGFFEGGFFEGRDEVGWDGVKWGGEGGGVVEIE